MTADGPPLVELVPAPIIHAMGVGRIIRVNEFVHYDFFDNVPDGAAADAPIVRAIVLHLIVPFANSLAGMRATAEALGLPPYGDPMRRRWDA